MAGGAPIYTVCCKKSLHMTYYPEFSRLLNQALHDQDRSASWLAQLDNVEHLLDGADFVAALVHDAPQVKLLVTSRMPLRLPAEQLFPLQGLGYGKMPDGTAADDMTAVAQCAGSSSEHGSSL